MKKPIDPKLIEKFLRGECNSEEEKAINEWYDSFDSGYDLVSSMSDAQRNLLKSRMRASVKTGEEHHGKKKTLRRIFYPAIGIAASLLLFFLVLPKNKPAPAQITGDLVVISNTTHRILERTLNDGTRVWLEPGSRLSFHKTFTGRTRNVNLTGESFFEVTKDAARPFVIYSSNLVTKVWGTSFRVRDSKSMPFADVTVVTGKVSVKPAHPGTVVINNIRYSNRDTEVMIYPEQNVIYTKSDRSFKAIAKVDMKDLHIWRKTNLSFDNKPMSEVLPVLNSEFDVNITAPDARVRDYLLSADFEGLNLPQVLEILHTTLNISYQIHGREISLQRIN